MSISEKKTDDFTEKTEILKENDALQEGKIPKENRTVQDSAAPQSVEGGTAGKPDEAEGAKEAEKPGEAEEAGTLPADLAACLDERILRAVREMGFTKPTPIQEQAIPLLMTGRDIIGQAQTGTGKTAAFGIPIIQKIDPDNRALQAIILCPTRELAVQAAAELRKLAKYMQGIKVLPVYGGQDISRQISGLKGTQIIVGTPGRVMDHMRRHTVKLDHVNMVVLDEADEMLDMGFREDMELILGEIPGEHQTALFSATMPQPILDITDKFQKNAQFIRVTPEELTIPLVSQYYYRIRSKDKDAACVRVLEYYQPKLCLIFCNTKKKVDELTDYLKQQGLQAEGLHGDMSQAQRDAAMGRFRKGSTGILIATDVAARGIDVENIEAVINYDVPLDAEYYVHRIGRTGRAGKTGTSYTFVTGREVFRIRQIERFCRTTIDEWKLPGASKVLKVKAEKILEQAWPQEGEEELRLMKKLIARKMEQEECEAMDIAATLLKYYVGDKGEEIQEDEEVSGGRRRRRGRRDDDGRDTKETEGGNRRRGDGQHSEEQKFRSREERRRERYTEKNGSGRENEKETKGGMKRGKASERNPMDGWWNGKKLPFSTRERRRKR